MLFNIKLNHLPDPLPDTSAPQLYFSSFCLQLLKLTGDELLSAN